MKRSTLLIALAAPLMLGAALPPERPALPGRSAEIVEVNVIDRFLKDTGIRKQSSTREKARTRSRNTSRNSIPKPPPLASVPLPIPKPAETAQKATPEPPLPANKPAQSDLAKPDEKAASSPVKTETKDQAKPPVVEQPSTATEPARQAEVPTPLPKPEPDTVTAKPDNTERGSPEKPAESQPAQAEVKPDSKPDEAGETEKAETPPPPPLEKEDPQELQACLADLKAIGAKFETTDPIDDGNGCGIEHPIDVAEVLPGVDLGGATMRCKTALTMAHWLKDTVQPAMTIAMPGRRIVGLVPGSTYQCRLRNSAATGKISEHARGNAYDVAAFKLDNGEKIEMKPRTEDSTLEGAFQRTATAGACLHFTTVLSPGSDASHEDHLHLDILERNGGYRYCR
ncbi:extensin family protein [Rhizobium sp.]|uniref:extensin-like domain-containing protein n=1 Tax=Rhizobium sp. TaxID=391 RepID=UPI0028A98A05